MQEQESGPGAHPAAATLLLNVPEAQRPGKHCSTYKNQLEVINVSFSCEKEGEARTVNSGPGRSPGSRALICVLSLSLEQRLRTSSHPSSPGSVASEPSHDEHRLHRLHQLLQL